MPTISIKTTIIVAVVSLLVGRYILTPKQKVKEVVKIVEVEKKRIDTKKKVVTKEIKQVDGSVVTERVETENTVSNSSRNTNVSSSKKTSTGAGISLGALAVKDATSLSSPTHGGIILTVPVVGNLKATGLATTNKLIGLGLLLEL